MRILCADGFPKAMTYPALKTLLDHHFHEDWMMVHSDPWQVLAGFVHEEPDLAATLAEEVSELLRRYTDETELREILLNEYSCGYWIDSQESSYREWLRTVVDQVTEQLSDYGK